MVRRAQQGGVSSAGSGDEKPWCWHLELELLGSCMVGERASGVHYCKPTCMHRLITHGAVCTLHLSHAGM
jgi:hypothetical protein